MAEKNIICGIDVGTTKIVAIIAEYSNEDFSIVGIGESKSEGLQRGVIVNNIILIYISIFIYSI